MELPHFLKIGLCHISLSLSCDLRLRELLEAMCASFWSELLCSCAAIGDRRIPLAPLLSFCRLCWNSATVTCSQIEDILYRTFCLPLSYPVILDSKLVTSRLWSQHVIGDTTLFTAVTQLVMDLPCVCALLFGPRNDGGNGNEVTRSHAKGGLQTSLTQLQSNTPSPHQR